MRRTRPRRCFVEVGIAILVVGATVGLVACKTNLARQLDAAKYAAFGATNIPRPKTLPKEEPSAAEQHKRLFEEEQYPSARACARCHPGHYEEWSVSPHAYAQMSPVFNTFHGAVVKLTNGTFGDFCIRCHSPVGMDLNEPFFQSNLYRHPASREGITCIVCHRPRAPYGKISNRASPYRGSIFDRVFGPAGGEKLAAALNDPNQRYGTLATKKGETGTKIHAEAKAYFHLSTPGFCGTCHDVTLGNGFRLEEAFSEYKSSPAAKCCITCQDCHMGKIQGKNSGYLNEPAACVNGKPTPARKRTNHMFAGPDHSIIHPGLFPHLGEEESQLANMTQWLQFDYEAGWGTEAYEEALFEKDEADRPTFPEFWNDFDKRIRAREILNKQFKLMSLYRKAQLEVLREGYKIGQKVVERADDCGVSFKIQVKNGTDGHNVPTGFIAERTVYLEVTVRDSEGKVIMRSGDVDPNGDVRDVHSLYVHDGVIPRDKQLFSLQSKFLTRMIRGGEREQILAINHSIDPLPFLRPPTRSNIWHGRPGGARIHRVGIEPCGCRWAHYCVPKCNLTGKTPYVAHVRMISGMVPVNLIYAIKDVGFDYGMSAREVSDKIVAGRLVLWDEQFLLQKGR